MSDWAEERAALLWSLDNWQGDLAKELRKAKADGMRQAISIIRMQDGFKAPLIEAFEKAEAVAAEIEKGSQ